MTTLGRQVYRPDPAQQSRLSEDRARVDWFLREHGRFPTYDELIALRRDPEETP